MNYINWFSNVEPALHIWDKSQLVIWTFHSTKNRGLNKRCLINWLILMYKGVQCQRCRHASSYNNWRSRAHFFFYWNTRTFLDFEVKKSSTNIDTHTFIKCPLLQFTKMKPIPFDLSVYESGFLLAIKIQKIDLWFSLNKWKINFLS